LFPGEEQAQTGGGSQKEEGDAPIVQPQYPAGKKEDEERPRESPASSVEEEGGVNS